jgi:putative Mn2+ efflux pump MntP
MVSTLRGGLELIAHMLSLILLAFAVSLDGFGVGVTYGLRKIRIPFLSILIIACCSGLVIWLSMQAGGWLSGFLSETAAKFIGAAILIGIGCWALIQLGLSKGNDEGTEASADRKTPAEAEGRKRMPKTDKAPTPANGLPPVDEANETFSAPTQVMKVELKTLGLVIQILRKPQVADVDRSGSISSSEAVMLGVALSIDAFGAGLGAALLGLPALLTAAVIALSSAFFLISGTYVGLRFSAKRSRHALSVLPGILLIMMGIMKML